MKKWMLIIVAIVIVGIIVFSFIQYRNVHTFTLTDLEASECICSGIYYFNYGRNNYHHILAKNMQACPKPQHCKL